MLLFETSVRKSGAHEWDRRTDRQTERLKLNPSYSRGMIIVVLFKFSLYQLKSLEIFRRQYRRNHAWSTSTIFVAKSTDQESGPYQQA